MSEEVLLGKAERRVCDLIVSGLSSQQIAEEVGRSLSTVKNQTIRIYRAYGVKNRVELTSKVRAKPLPPVADMTPNEMLISSVEARLGTIRVQIERLQAEEAALTTVLETAKGREIFESSNQSR